MHETFKKRVIFLLMTEIISLSGSIFLGLMLLKAVGDFSKYKKISQGF